MSFLKEEFRRALELHIFRTVRYDWNMNIKYEYDLGTWDDIF